VEKRLGRDECFGQNRTPSRQVSMTVSELVETLHNEESGDLYYLSTQQEQDDDEDDQEVASPSSSSSSSFQVPCRQLLQSSILDDTLDWAGNLVLESCNLWMGCTPRPPRLLRLDEDDPRLPPSPTVTANMKGSCSGLHHDFHDNFYLLLQGRKEIRLYSPDAAPYMQLRGQVECIHFNGVISYVGKETRADGVPMTLVDNHNNKEKKNGHAAKVDQGSKENSDNDDEEEEEEEELVLGKGFDYVSSSEEDDTKHTLLNEEDAVDDYDDTCSPGGNVADASPENSAASDTDKQAVNNKNDKDNTTGQYSDDEEDEEEGELVLGKGFDYVSSDEDEEDDARPSSVLEADDAVDDYEEIFPSQQGENGYSISHPPKGHDPPGDNFSRIGNPAASTTSSRFPEFWENCQTCVVELQAGQSLYIPAGWFHSVTSFGGASVDDTDKDYKNDIHMALNYWYHPPDALDCFDKPYIHEEDVRAAGR
jgi:hypothetical protein